MLVFDIIPLPLTNRDTIMICTMSGDGQTRPPKKKKTSKPQSKK